MNVYDLYVITTWSMYSDVSMHGQDVYPTVEAAQAVVDAIDPKYKRDIKYYVSTLDDYISEVRRDAYSSGEHAADDGY